MKRQIQDYLILFLPVGLIIILDQLTKSWVRSNLALGQSTGPEWLLPYVRIVHWYNTGVAFGMFQGIGKFFIILAIIISIAIIFYFPRVPRQDWALRIALIMQMAGALGNLIDRVTVGHVTDFIAIGNFPVWNVADASITVGVGVLILGIWLQECREKRNKTAIESGQSETSSNISKTGEEGTS